MASSSGRYGRDDDSMILVETHAHLDDRQFDADRDAVVQRAVEAGVRAMVTVGTSLSSSRAAVALADRYAPVYATVGVHPHDADQVDDDVVKTLRELARHPRVVAIGEIGLDFYRDLSPRQAQRAAFRAQLALAAELGKPVVIHIRDKRGQRAAYEEVLEALHAWVSGMGSVRAPSPRGVLHCYSGDLSTAQAVMALDFLIGVDGPVTFPNAAALQAMVAELPLESLVLETDCPYLAPQARRGRRNEPAYLPFIATKVAELKEIGADHLAAVATANACRLFRLPRAGCA